MNVRLLMTVQPVAQVLQGQGVSRDRQRGLLDEIMGKPLTENRCAVAAFGDVLDPIGGQQQRDRAVPDQAKQLLRVLRSFDMSPDSTERGRFKTGLAFWPTPVRQKSSAIALARGCLSNHSASSHRIAARTSTIDSSRAIRSSTTVQSSGIPLRKPRSSDAFNRAITEAQRSQWADSKYSMTSSWLHEARE